MLPQADPRGGGKPRRVHWSYAKLPLGAKETGYIGARTQWIWLHSAQQSKPCLHEITGGELDCPYCRTLRPAEVKGFVGIYREADWKPIAFWVNEDHRDLIESMKLHTRVERSREKTKGSPIALRPMLDQNPRFVSALPERQVWCDSTVSLLALLKCPILIEWMRQTHGPESVPSRTPAMPPESQVAPPVVAEAPPQNPREIVHLLGNSFIPAGPAGDKLRELRNRNEAFIEDAKREKKNGKH